MSLFDECDLAEIESAELFPGERLIVCKNHALAEDAGASGTNCSMPPSRT
jgi:hypothetical protein